MRKITRKKKKSHPSTQALPSSRNGCLDSLRGLAIVLMVIDHVAFLFFDSPIAVDSIRFPTRLSMPLFAVLMGYFLTARGEKGWSRLLQVAAATVAINIVYYELYQQLEILASLLACTILFLGIGRWFAILALAVFVYPLDPTTTLFNFPMSVVACCVAQGVILRWQGWQIAMATSLFALAGLWLVEPPSSYLLYFLPVATLLVAVGERYRELAVPWVSGIGRYPLTAYLAQYFILFAIKYS